MFRYQNDMEMFQAALGIQSLGLLDIGNLIKKQVNYTSS